MGELLINGQQQPIWGVVAEMTISVTISIMRELETLPAPHIRAAVSLFVPPLVAVIVLGVVANLTGISTDSQQGLVVLLGGTGIAGWIMGSVWYGFAGMGLRGGRPLFASAGFAVISWVAMIIIRFFYVDSSITTTGGVGLAFVYLLVFEAFLVQTWLFGVFFRSMADWRGPLTAAIFSGLLFAITGFLFFQESFEASPLAAVYFAAWGVYYGLIRLRAGSYLGTALVQAFQSLTAWYILLPVDQPPPGSLNVLYIGMTIVYAILIWRLWPSEESDYRV